MSSRNQTGLVLIAMAVGAFLFALMMAIHSPTGRMSTFSRDEDGGEAPWVGPSVEAAEFKLSGPYTHGNLSVFLVHGPDRLAGKNYMTLQEALEAKKAVVYETGNVNQLSVENLSKDEELFIQSGDIVKGGQQDRTLEYDLIVPPASGKVPLASFCVENSRWQKRGAEDARSFSASACSLNTKELKIAARYRKNQGEVWKNVAEAQKKLEKSVGQDVRSADSATSLQLTLENQAVQDATGPYLAGFIPLIEGKDDVIGYAFAVNGHINSAEVYGSHALFKKLWPKLIRASAIEAVASRHDGGRPNPFMAEEVEAFLKEVEAGNTVEQGTAGNVRQITQETKKSLLFETRDKDKKDGWIHRSYLTK